MTVISPAGILLRALGAMERQSKIANDTMIIIATSAAMRIPERTRPKTIHNSIKKTPARKADRRVRAPDTFISIIIFPDHGAVTHAAEEAGYYVGDTLPGGFATYPHHVAGPWPSVHGADRSERLRGTASSG